MIQVVIRALAVCERLAQHAPQTLTELATGLEVRRSTLGNLLGTLVAAGYLIRDRAGYRLTRRFAMLTAPLPAHDRFRQLAEESCRQIAERSGAGAAVTVLAPRGKLVVAQAEAAGVDTLLKRADWRDSPLWLSATGRILMAYAPRARRQSVENAIGPAASNGWRQAVDAATLERLLDGIREQGHCALSIGPRRLSMAVPIFGTGGKQFAALGIYAELRPQLQERSRLTRLLRQAGSELSAACASLDFHDPIILPQEKGHLYRDGL